ncbi:hypothetical protein PRIPAC_79534 [Pristionchus pacificus]|uniref:Nuclear receptor n=1 Tax=Pristionchus pacificus TaxID=54126 RepID=A0A2A6C3A7_PRIPA|nr:hypothetical protein PRIPAC_79534 [Pristionchus pacificus]|eukprot:PDM72587.1 nuclear receptor [Pristionchus pacificus]
MVRPRESREKRLCLACGGSTRISHFGVDLCRACAVFHRRSIDRSYVCRSKTNECQSDISRCRKCRLKKIERLIKVPLVSTSDLNEMQITSDTPLLLKLIKCYRMMCETRLVSELSYRSPPVHPLEMNESDFIPNPATPTILNNSNRIFLSVILKFGDEAFPEFNELNKTEKWSVATNFFHRFRLFECGFRADKKFPDDLNKSFGSYTTFVSEDIAKFFYDDANSNTMFAQSLKKDLRKNRERFRRLKLHDKEFIAVLALMFWNTENSTMSETVLQVGATYKSTILQELYYFYRTSKNLDGYASRLGEVLLLLDVYNQLSTELNHKYELLRLANVFTEDNVLYNATSNINFFLI